MSAKKRKKAKLNKNMSKLLLEIESNNPKLTTEIISKFMFAKKLVKSGITSFV